MRIRKILCPVDFSEPARDALLFAADLAQQYDAELTLLHVYQIPGYAFPEGIVLAGPEVMAELMVRIDKVLGEWKSDAEGHGAMRVSTLSVQGAPWNEIVRTAREQGYDLVVIGTHGRTGLKHVILGSVAEKVVRRAPCPVLTVRLASHLEAHDNAGL
ncbi:MAG: universal stress protein [Deltaproteobacteria bacterium]|nr:universal stress protein [Deltaproteobacteria bacterium]